MQAEYCVAVQNGTDTAEARRTAMQLASRLGFDESEAGNAGLVVTEASRNLIKHAGGGEILLRALQQDDAVGVEMLGLDKGPGIDNVARSFQDGYSTAGTPGNGLGAIARLSTLHDLYTQAGKGTVLLSQIWKRTRTVAATPAARLETGIVSVPKKGEDVCGDSWAVVGTPPSVRVIVADGLGHGLFAADASRAAVSVAAGQPGLSGVRLMERMHEALRPTRGAAVAVAEIHAGRGVVQFTGVGNIAGCIVAPAGAVQHMVSYPGTVGHETHKMMEFQYPWHPGSVLVMHSDGLSSSWSLERYPGLISRHSSIAAGVLYRDYRRERDDATVVVLRQRGSGN